MRKISNLLLNLLGSMKFVVWVGLALPLLSLIVTPVVFPNDAGRYFTYVVLTGSISVILGVISTIINHIQICCRHKQQNEQYTS